MGPNLEQNLMIGKRFGKLTVVSSARRSGQRRLLWHCICACGNTKVVRSDHLRIGETKSCGCLVAELNKQGRTPPKDITGQQFARLTALHIDPIRKGKQHTYWICRCRCGAIRSIEGSRLRNGTTKSCGCWARELLRLSMTQHGDSYSLEYKSWTSMIERCTNHKSPKYAGYGGRGIKVCQRWLKSYANFLADMGRRPTQKHSLDRINNSLGYSRMNCRWSTPTQQNNNKRTNRPITYKDATRTLSEWSALTGIHKATIHGRLDRRIWPVGQALGFEIRSRDS